MCSCKGRIQIWGNHSIKLTATSPERNNSNWRQYEPILCVSATKIKILLTFLRIEVEPLAAEDASFMLNGVTTSASFVMKMR